MLLLEERVPDLGVELGCEAARVNARVAEGDSDLAAEGERALAELDNLLQEHAAAQHVLRRHLEARRERRGRLRRDGVLQRGVYNGAVLGAVGHEEAVLGELL